MKPTQALKILFFACLLPAALRAQPAKQINHQVQTWFSINTTARISSHWALLADLHIRRNHFLAQNNFEFLRLGAQYSFEKNLSVAAGMGHMWLHSTQPGMKTVAQENRIYEQLVYQSGFGRIDIQQRLRLEQRWQQKLNGDLLTGDRKFTQRFRYLVSLFVPLSRNERVPRLNLSDEICLQAGREVVYNPFDQNRLFIGLRQKINSRFSFDTGYMLVVQQKSSGYQVDENNTFRLFLYFTPNLAPRRHS